MLFINVKCSHYHTIQLSSKGGSKCEVSSFLTSSSSIRNLTTGSFSIIITQTNNFCLLTKLFSSCTCLLFNPAFTIIFTSRSRIWIRKFNSHSPSKNWSYIMESIYSFSFLLLNFLNFPKFYSCKQIFLVFTYFIIIKILM